MIMSFFRINNLEMDFGGTSGSKIQFGNSAQVNHNNNPLKLQHLQQQISVSVEEIIEQNSDEDTAVQLKSSSSLLDNNRWTLFSSSSAGRSRNRVQNVQNLLFQQLQQ
jgi:hypothetical protein